MTSETRTALLDAAVDHLDRHGLDGLTLRELARSCGVSHGAPLRHFPSLAALLAEVAADAFVDLHGAVARATAIEGGHPLEELRAAGRAYVEFATTHRGAFELMFRPDLVDRSHERYLTASWAAFEQLAALTASAQSTGWMPGVPALVLTGVLWSGVHGIAALWLQGSLPAATGMVSFDALLDVFQTDFAGLPAPAGRVTRS